MAMIGPDGKLALQCIVCDGTDFEAQESREESRWGFTSHRMTLMVCRTCSHVMHFYDAHSMWNPS